MMTLVLHRLILRRPAFVLAAGAALLGALVPAPAWAQAAKPGVAARKPVTLKEAVVQVDGITGRVVDQLWVQVDKYWHDGDYNRIVELCRLCVEADPHFLEAYSAGAWLLWSLDRTGEADAFLKQGVAANPNRYDLHFDFGSHLVRTKRDRDALPYLQAATRHKNAPAQAWSVLAHCYRRLGRLDEALATWQTVVKRFPNFAAGPPNLRRIQEMKRNSGGSGPG